MFSYLAPSILPFWTSLYGPLCGTELKLQNMAVLSCSSPRGLAVKPLGTDWISHGYKRKGKCHSCGNAEPQLWHGLMTFDAGLTTQPCWEGSPCYSFWYLYFNVCFWWTDAVEVCCFFLFVISLPCFVMSRHSQHRSLSRFQGMMVHNAKHVMSLIWFLAILYHPVAKSHSCTSLIQWPLCPKAALALIASFFFFPLSICFLHRPLSFQLMTFSERMSFSHH